jgi:hypothetical protein
VVFLRRVDRRKFEYLDKATMNRLIYILYLGVLAIVSLTCIFTANRAKLRDYSNSLAESSFVDEYEVCLL